MFRAATLILSPPAYPHPFIRDYGTRLTFLTDGSKVKISFEEKDKEAKSHLINAEALQNVILHIFPNIGNINANDTMR